MVVGTRPAALPRVVVVLTSALAIGVLVSVVAVMPGVRTTPGFNPTVDGWVKGATYLSVGLLVMCRAVLRPERRAAWSWLAAGYVLHALGFAAWLGWVRWQDPVPSPSIADAAWLLTAPAFLVGLVLLVRDRWPRRSLAVLLDALAAAAVAAAVTLAFLSGAVEWGRTIDGPAVIVALAYPLMDTALITAVMALLVGLGARTGSAAIRWLAVSMIGMAAVNVVFAVQTAAGTFRPASPLSGVAVAVTAAGALAAWLPDRDVSAADRTALPGLGVPTLVGTGAIGVLLAHSRFDLSVISGLLAALGLLLLAARIGQTLRVAREVGILRQAQHIARVGSWVSDPGTVARNWSAAHVGLLGLDHPAVAEQDDVGRLVDMIVAEDQRTVLAALRDGERTGRIDVTYRARSSEGEVRNVRARAEADLDESGRPTNWVGTLQDVTKRHQLASALAESEAMLRRVLTATNDGWWTVELPSDHAFVSDRWWGLHGYEPWEFPAVRRPWQPVLSPDVAARLEAEVEEAAAGMLPSLSVTLISRHRDGRDLPIVLRMLLEYDDGDELVRLSAAATDMTAARRAQEARDALIAAVSHELRTPLTPIVGFSEMLRRDGSLSTDQRQAVQAIERNATHMLALVDELLAATRTRRPSPEPKAQVLDLTEHIQTLLTNRGDIEAEFVEPTSPMPASVNPTHLTQILNNLLDNAARHGEPPIEIHVEQQGVHAVITVTDNGPGVPDEFIPELFDDFSQATTGDQRPTLGLGLGLAIAKRLAEANHLTLYYARSEGQTAFQLRIPLSRPLEDNADHGPPIAVES